MYSLVSLIFSIFPVSAMHSLLVTLLKYMLPFYMLPFEQIGQIEHIFSTTGIYVKRLPKGQEPIFWFALPTDQLLICLHQNKSICIEICGLNSLSGLENLGKKSKIWKKKFMATRSFSFIAFQKSFPKLSFFAKTCFRPELVIFTNVVS